MNLSQILVELGHFVAKFTTFIAVPSINHSHTFERMVATIHTDRYLAYRTPGRVNSQSIRPRTHQRRPVPSNKRRQRQQRLP